MTAALEQMVVEGRIDQQVGLVREHWFAVRHLWLDTPDPLRVARLGPDLPPDFWMTAGMPGLATVTAHGHRFEFAEGGKPALILPAYDAVPGTLDANPARHVEELRDLIAVDLDLPDRHWRHRGEALVLGNAFLEIAGQEGAPVPIFRNPLTWLRSGGAGIVVLDWNYVPDLLLGFEMTAEDVDLGNQLAAALKPDIWVMEAA